ncbi:MULTISPECIES: DUF2523 family protein [Burkholderia cepacia complex]|uniref:DUF2523 family protein n=1 Tax=Burkholderia cepacia complex TaxID=87882 RepID=UPI0009BCCD37|nr:MULTISPECIES: DUF2523 family protein [Burkholderia cepacia complex]MCA8094473.1 DUF2523 domain-containing protein [Burkholderia anthina]MDN7616610.1 DUF2523 family protein [Burkholderia cepacia]
MSWASFLLSAIGPLVVRGLLAIGVGVVTVQGVDLALSQLMSWITSAVGGIPADLVQVLAIGGVFQGLGYVCGAFAARVTLAGVSAAKRFFLR